MDDIQSNLFKNINTIAPNNSCARRLFKNDATGVNSENLCLKEPKECNSLHDLKDISEFQDVKIDLLELSSVNGKENLTTHSYCNIAETAKIESGNNERNGDDESVEILHCSNVNDTGPVSNITSTEGNSDYLLENMGCNREKLTIKIEEVDEKFNLNDCVVQYSQGETTIQESDLPNESIKQLIQKVSSNSNAVNEGEYVESPKVISVILNNMNYTSQTTEKIVNENISLLSNKNLCSSRTTIASEINPFLKSDEVLPIKSNNCIEIEVAPNSLIIEKVEDGPFESGMSAKSANIDPKVKFDKRENCISSNKDVCHSLKSSRATKQNELSPFCKWAYLIKRPDKFQKGETKMKPKGMLIGTEKNEPKTLSEKIFSDKQGKESKEKQKENIQPFISNDPCENADNNNPEWEVLKKLETDEERYKAVRNRWRNLAIPDPNKNLTKIFVKSCFKPPLTCGTDNHEAKKSYDSSVESRVSTSRKRTLSCEPSTSTDHAPAKRFRTRSCTTSYDLKVLNHKRKMEEEERKLVLEKKMALSESRNEYNREWSRLMASNLKYYNYAEFQSRLERLHSYQRQLVDSVQRKYSGALNKLEEENRKKTLMFKNAIKEVEAFHKFYRKLDENNTKNDCFFLTESELDDVFETDKLYEKFDDFYS